MARRHLRPPARAAAWTLLLLCGAGCGQPGYERYVPAEPAARQALETALRAWQDGRPVGQLDAAEPPLMVVDSTRRPGRELRRFEVLGELTGDGPRRFAVRLVLAKPDEEQKARFVVFGIRPVWVFRLEDYEMMAHWECKAPPEKESPAADANAR